MIKKRVLIATGGTGGHVFPTISLANFLENNNYEVKVTTDKRGLNYLKDHKHLNLIEIPASRLVKKKYIQNSVININYSLFNYKIFYIFII